MATIILPPGAGEAQLRIRVNPLPDGSTQLDIDFAGDARPMIPLADAARSLVEPGLPKDIERAEIDSARKRIIRAKSIRRTGTLIDQGDFAAWSGSRGAGGVDIFA